jgi:hypothetical protein
MSKEEALSKLKKQVSGLVETLIISTNAGSLSWLPSTYSPRDLEPFARVVECYSATKDNTTFFIYKRISYPEQQRSLFSSAAPVSENILEWKAGETGLPFRAPYVPITDELLLIVSKKALLMQSDDVSRIAETLSR